MKIIQYYLIILFTLSISMSYANPPIQQGTVTGKVVAAETLKPLVGANIMVKHSSIGSYTTTNGRFIIPNVPIGKVDLIVSMIGYKNKDTTIIVHRNEATDINIQLTQTLLEMGSVLVTGTATPHLYEDIPVKTEVITRLTIEEKNARNLAEVLSFETGIQVENDCQNCNFTQVRILGMDGKYSQILIDGNPVISSLAGVYGLEHIPAEMIDKVEIVKGGGSALYGAGAVAGVINLITRQPKLNQTRLRYQFRSLDGSPDRNLGITAEIVNEDETSGAYLFAATRDRQHYDRNGDHYSELGNIKNESLGLNWFLQTGDEHHLQMHLHRIHENRRGGNKFNLPFHEADIAEAVEHWKWGGSLQWIHEISSRCNYNAYYSFSTLTRDSYYGGLGGGRTHQDTLAAMAAYGKTNNPLHTTGAKIDLSLGDHLITSGIQYRQETIEDNAVVQPSYTIDKIFKNLGLFFQDNMHFGPGQQFELVTGLRADIHSELDEIILSPRINAKYNFPHDICLRAGLTTGFKAPQVFDEDLHICGLEGGQKVIRNSDDLNEEKSYTGSLNIEYLGELKPGFSSIMAITIFYTRIDHIFIQRYKHSLGKVDIWERVNSNKGATIKGIETEGALRPREWLELRLGFTYKKARYDQKLDDWNTTHFLRTPALSANGLIKIDLDCNFSMNVDTRYLGTAKIPHEIVIPDQEAPELTLEKSESFIQINCYLTHRLNEILGINNKIKAGIKNITDAYQTTLDSGPQRDPGFVYGPSLPRTFFISLETSF